MRENLDFPEFWRRFERFFARSESRDQAKLYIQGLLKNSIRRKNSWQIAQEMGQQNPQAMQRLLFSTNWNLEGFSSELRLFIKDRIGHHEGICILGETSFIKKGAHSAGVKPQWSLETKRMDNCQIGVFLGYCSPLGTALIDRKLYLPRDWCKDDTRRSQVKIPEHIKYLTKPELGQEMLSNAIQNKLPIRWVIADTAYGNLSEFRDYVSSAGKWYILEISALTSVRLMDDEPPQTVAQIVSNWIDMRWDNSLDPSGNIGWCYQRVASPNDRQYRQWLIAKREGQYPFTYTYFFSNAPADMPLNALVITRENYHKLSHTLEITKNETGLDEYEVRHWHGWYRHITFSMAAYAFAYLANQELMD